MTALPPLPPPQAVDVPTTAERTLASGLRIIAAQRRGVARTELRVSLPIAHNGRSSDHAALTLLGRTLLSGTVRRSATEIADGLRGMGAQLTASSDMEQLRLSGGVLTRDLRPFLELAADVAGSPAFPDRNVTLERARTAQEVQMARRRPQVAGTAVLIGRLYGRHPYGRVLPDAAAVAGVRASAVRRLHARAVGARGGTVVVVGSGTARATLDAADEAFRSLPAPEGAGHFGPPTSAPAPGITVLDRPGAVQTVLLLGGPVAPLGHPDDAAVQVAAAVLGGHTSARLGANLRTRHGFAYFVECSIQRRRLASQVVIAAGVTTSVTARALVELRYELARLGTEPVPPAELEAARRHVCGRLSLAVQTRAGLANQLAGLDAAGLDAATLPRLATAVASTTAEDVLVAARRYFAPRRLVTVLVGDATVIRPALDGLDDVEVLTSV